MKQYNTDFPDDIFNINQATEEDLERCKNTNIMFCGIAKDCGEHLERNIQRIQRTAKYFKDYKVFIYENNSTDETKDILREYESENFKIMLDDIEDPNRQDMVCGNHYERCKRIAEARNKYMNFVSRNYENYEITAIIDLDIIGGWSYNGLLRSLSDLNDTQVCVSSYGAISVIKSPLCFKKKFESANDLKYMYDSFAFRNYQHYMLEQKLGTPISIIKNIQATHNLIDRPKQNTVIMSNFNGLALYNSKSIKDLRYKTRFNEELADSEHVCFHRDLLNTNDEYRIIMSSNMVVSYSPHRYTE